MLVHGARHVVGVQCIVTFLVYVVIVFSFHFLGVHHRFPRAPLLIPHFHFNLILISCCVNHIFRFDGGVVARFVMAILWCIRVCI